MQVARAAREAQEAEGVPGAVRGGHREARRGVSVPRKAAAWSLKAFGSPDPRNRRSASEFSVLVVRGSSAHEAAHAGKSCGHPRCVRGRRACQHARARAGDGPRATRASRQRDDQRLPLAVSSLRFVPFVRSHVPTRPGPTSRSGAPRAGAPRFSSPPRSPTRPSLRSWPPARRRGSSRRSTPGSARRFPPPWWRWAPRWSWPPPPRCPPPRARTTRSGTSSCRWRWRSRCWARLSTARRSEREAPCWWRSPSARWGRSPARSPRTRSSAARSARTPGRSPPACARRTWAGRSTTPPQRRRWGWPPRPGAGCARRGHGRG